MWVPRWRGNQQITQSTDHSISRSLNFGQFFDQVAHLRLQARLLDRRRKTNAAYAAKAFADARNDFVVAADGGEGVHHVVRYGFGHFLPLADAGELVESFAELSPAVRFQDAEVRRRGTVERQLAADALELLLYRLIGGPGGDEATARELDGARRPAGFRRAARDVRQDHLVEVLARAEVLQADAFAELAGQPAHGRVDRRHRHRDLRVLDRPGVEERRRIRVAVVLADERRLGAVLPRIPDSAQSEDVLAHARDRRRPVNGEAFLVVLAHLAADAEPEASLREALQI